MAAPSIHLVPFSLLNRQIEVIQSMDLVLEKCESDERFKVYLDFRDYKKATRIRNVSKFLKTSIRLHHSTDPLSKLI
jgi:hypothetical protein